MKLVWWRLLMLTVGGLAAGETEAEAAARCGSKPPCPPDEYCSDLYRACFPCEDICDTDDPSGRSADCYYYTNCRAFLQKLEQQKLPGDGDESSRHTVTTTLYVLVGVLVLLLLGITARCVIKRRRRAGPADPAAGSGSSLGNLINSIVSKGKPRQPDRAATHPAALNL